MPLRRPDIEKEYDSTFLRSPESPTVETLKTGFDRPVTNLIDKANNVIEMIPKNDEKQDLDKYDLQLVPEVEASSLKYVSQGNNDDQTINELTEDLSKTDKGEVPKQLEIFERGQHKEFEDKMKLIGLSTDSIKFLEFLQSDFCQEIFIKNKLKIRIEAGIIFFHNLDTNESIYGFFQEQEIQSKAKINFEFSFTDSYGDYFDWLVQSFKGNEDKKYDFLTNKNSKYLFY